MKKRFIGQIQTLTDIEADTTPDKAIKDQPKTTAAQQLETAVKDLSHKDFRKDTKDQRLTIRLSSKDRESMERVAESLGLTVADYLIQLHHVAAAHLQASNPQPQ